MRYTVLILLMACLAAGCGGQQPIDPRKAMNDPRSREEAYVLMESVDALGEQHAWPRPVAQRVRESMTDRLLIAGIPQREIDTWVHSAPRQLASNHRTETL